MPQNSDVSKIDISGDHITAEASRRLGVGFAPNDAFARVRSAFWTTHSFGLLTSDHSGRFLPRVNTARILPTFRMLATLGGQLNPDPTRTRILNHRLPQQG